MKGFLIKAVPVSALLCLAAATAVAGPAGSVDFAAVKPATPLRANDKVMGKLAASHPIHAVISLKLRNRKKLHALIASHQTLTPVQFKAKFSPTVGQARAAANFLKRSGFANVTISPNRLLISGNASARVAQTAFHTTLVRVRTHTGRNAFANNSAVKVPGFLRDSVIAVLGLQNVHTFHTVVPAKHHGDVTTNAITGHNPTEFASIYSNNGVPTASGIPIGIVTQGSLTNVLNDLQQFTSSNGIPSVNTQVVNTDGTSNDTSGDGEWDLDSQDIVGMAGGRLANSSSIIFQTCPIPRSRTISTPS